VKVTNNTRGWMVALLVLGACTAAVPEPQPEPQPRPLDLLALYEPVDRDPRPEVLSVELRAVRAHVRLDDTLEPELWTYDGRVPGPLLRVPKGGTIEVDLDNALDEPTTIHWHGMRVPNEQDGVALATIPALLPGQRRHYTLPAKDAGLFWYHPHVRSAAQLGFGLYGAIWVVDPDEARIADDDVVLVLSDLGLTESGVLDSPSSGGDLATLFGREGNVVLVNGRLHPVLEARVGRRQRWRLVNAARSRYFWLELPGQRWWKIGEDGGLADRVTEIERVLLIPGERVDLVVEPQREGEVPLRWVPYDRGFGSTEFRDPEDILRYRVAAGDVAPTGEPPALPGTPPPRVTTQTSTRASLRLTQSSRGEPFSLGINGVPADRAPPVHAHIGDTFELEIDNQMDWDHPFHVHGFFFEAIDAAGVPQSPRVLKDTINVPRREKRRVRILFDERPGMWMFHCHILDHADAGMMSMFMLSEPH